MVLGQKIMHIYIPSIYSRTAVPISPLVEAICFTFFASFPYALLHIVSNFETETLKLLNNNPSSQLMNSILKHSSFFLLMSSFSETCGAYRTPINVQLTINFNFLGTVLLFFCRKTFT